MEPDDEDESSDDDDDDDDAYYEQRYVGAVKKDPALRKRGLPVLLPVKRPARGHAREETRCPARRDWRSPSI